jgi:hypothetical protein
MFTLVGTMSDSYFIQDFASWVTMPEAIESMKENGAIKVLTYNEFFGY